MDGNDGRSNEKPEWGQRDQDCQQQRGRMMEDEDVIAQDAGSTREGGGH